MGAGRYHDENLRVPMRHQLSAESNIRIKADAACQELIVVDAVRLEVRRAARSFPFFGVHDWWRYMLRPRNLYGLWTDRSMPYQLYCRSGDGFGDSEDAISGDGLMQEYALPFSKLACSN